MLKNKTKYFLLVSILLSTIFFANCESKEENAPAGKPVSSVPALVYLKVEKAVASSFDETPDWAPMPNPMAPVDGDLLTRWSPKLGSDNEWIYFDFGKPKSVSKILIRWEAAYAVDYEVLYSNDAVDWKQLGLMKGQDGEIDEFDFSPVTARYIKIVGLKRSNKDWSFSFWEFEMYGPQRLNPTDKSLEETFPERKQKSAPEALIKEEPVASPGKIKTSEFQKGVVYTSWGQEELSSVASDLALEHLYNNGVRHIGLMVVWFQKTTSSDIIFSDKKDTPKDEALIHAINKAHSLGMKVMLKPHVDIKTDEWRGDIIASDNWFKNYKDYMLYYAKLSEEHNVEMFCIGTEFVNITISKWYDQWLDIINAVRSVYEGPLSYSANWNEYEDVPFWKDLDYIGIDAYFPLTASNNPTKDELVVAWEELADKIGQWLKDMGLENKPVIFSEIGYSSADGTNKEPWRTFSHLPLDRVDEGEQADCLDAMLTVMSKRPWFKGMYWWNYFPKEIYAPLGFKLRNKKGEKILSEWYKSIK